MSTGKNFHSEEGELRGKKSCLKRRNQRRRASDGIVVKNLKCQELDSFGKNFLDDSTNGVGRLTEEEEVRENQFCSDGSCRTVHENSSGRHVETGQNDSEMTWKKGFSHLTDRIQGRDKMGANGSSHIGRLKSRSQSSSALYCIKTGVCGSRHGDVQKSAHRHAPCSGCNNCSVLSHSIPTDIWDLPPTTKSFSPLTRKRQGGMLRHQHSVEYTLPDADGVNNRENSSFYPPLISHSSEKRGKKYKDKGGTGRGQIYAMSCPNVAQDDEGLTNMGFEEYTDSEYQSRSHKSSSYDINSENSPDLYRKRANRSRLSFTHSVASCQERDKIELGRIPDDSYKYFSNKRTNPIVFPSISEADIFEVRLIRDQRGLGLSVTGGSDSQETYPGLIRIKKVFPMSPAYVSGKLKAGDIILKANGVNLTGLTNNGALEVLRTTPVETILTVCRPPVLIPGFQISEPRITTQSHPQLPREISKPPEAPKVCQDMSDSGQFNFAKPAAVSHSSSIRSKSLSSLKIPGQSQSKNYGEFEVTLEKINGSLGFTIRQEDTSILGHYVRALVKDPALSDGRIQPGDRILSVNGYDLTGVGHAEAIAFLRQCPVKVTLQLYRDVAPTPVSPLSPTESHKSLKSKHLRQEAIDMLNDLAIRKQMSGGSGSHGLNRAGKSEGKLLHSKAANSPISGDGPATLPRRRNHGVTPSPEALSAALNRFAGKVQRKSENLEIDELNKKNSDSSLPIETRSSGSGESTPVSTIRSRRKCKPLNPIQLQENELNDSVNLDDSFGLADIGLKEKKSAFGQCNLHLDRISSFEDDSLSSDLNHADSIASEPGLSMFLDKGSNFRHGKPTYHSAIVPSTRGKREKKLKTFRDDSDITGHKDSDMCKGYSNAALTLDREDDSDHCDDITLENEDDDCDMPDSKSGGLLKWKGVVFSQDSDNDDAFYDHIESDTDSTVRLRGLKSALDTRNCFEPTSDEDEMDATRGKNQSHGSKILPPRRSPDGREFHDCDMLEISTSESGEQIFTIQLSRRWCSRLGFSLVGENGHTFISAIYPDSVASKDGRLRVGDEILMINGSAIRDINTSEVIDMMRKTRGAIDITILRKPNGNESGTNTNVGSPNASQEEITAS